MSQSTDYLYGVDSKTFMDLPYKDALNFKIKAAKSLLKVLFEPGYLKADHYRINSVSKAIKFNLNLLEELKC